MDYSEFRDYAISGAKAYWNYLHNNGKGISSTKVSHISIHRSEVYLYLLGRLSPAGIDSIQLQLSADRYPTEMIRPIEYRSEEGILVLRPHKDILRILPSGPCENVYLISDLLFLVARVGQWYERNPDPFSLPNLPPAVSPPSLEQMAGGSPSEEQFTTVQGVLSSPFSYVWGAPGTGKTRYVLANCILAYLREDRRIILVAPTNNALEQMLSGVLEVLFSERISPSRIRRLGIPSKSFAGRYPEVCEHRSTESRRASLTRQIELLHDKLGAVKNRQATEDALSSFSILNDLLITAAETYQSSCVPQAKISSLQDHIRLLQGRVGSLGQQLDAMEIWQLSFPGRLCRFFLPSEYTRRTRDNAALSRERESLEQQLHSCQTDLEEDLLQNDRAFCLYRDALENIFNQFSSLCQVYDDLISLPNREINPLELSGLLPRLIEKLRSSLASLPPFSNAADAAQLSAQLQTCQQSLARLEERDETSWSEIRVLAMTIDRYISMYATPVHQDYTPEHIFMDEAAYCSLVKGFVLLASGCPLTLLGDHAQLPPVCEMSDNDFQDESVRPVFLFSQSAIHIESVFFKSFSELYLDYIRASGPVFQQLCCYALPVTYRFGSNLTSILSEHIYTYGLRSAKDAPLSIHFVHAPASSRDQSRTSRAECQAIASILRHLPTEHADFAVLSPYRSQTSLLSKLIPSAASSGRIMTIHASQGREFDTVILSVVDTSRKYYVNSSIPVGRSVINTAVSRAKNQLILVLDADYWYTQEHQMIGQLLRLASPLPPYPA